MRDLGAGCACGDRMNAYVPEGAIECGCFDPHARFDSGAQRCVCSPGWRPDDPSSPYLWCVPNDQTTERDFATR